MKKDYKSHLFVPPKKDNSKILYDFVDDKLSSHSDRKKSLGKTMKDIRDGMILYGHEQK